MFPHGGELRFMKGGVFLDKLSRAKPTLSLKEPNQHVKSIAILSKTLDIGFRRYESYI